MGRAGAPSGGAALLAAGRPAPPPIGRRPAADLHTFRPLSRHPRIETCTELLKGPRAARTGRAARGGREGNALRIAPPPRPPSLPPCPGTVLGGTAARGRASNSTLCSAPSFLRSEPLRHREALGHTSTHTPDHTEHRNVTPAKGSAGQDTATSASPGGGMAASCLRAGRAAGCPYSCGSSSRPAPAPAQPRCPQAP